MHEYSPSQLWPEGHSERSAQRHKKSTRNILKKDAALSRRFAKVTIEEPTVADSIAILLGLKKTYEEHHKVVDYGFGH